MEEDQSPLDVAVGRMQQEFHVEEGEIPSFQRQERDHQRLSDLSVDNTSGDTLVIVKFPKGDFVNCRGRQWTTKEFLMQSEQLLATGSSVFANLLSPRVQAQMRRRLDGEYEAHQYVLDLTPQVEGDESASEVAQLSLSHGVREWWRSHYFLHISKYLVAGHDDNCPYHLEALIADEENQERMKTKGTRTKPIDIDELENPRPRQILDYCPIRHRAAILRLLLAIRGDDLVLNSASRVVTTAMVAKQFDCVNIVGGPVLSWFLAEPNENFIDVNAEDAFKISWTLELQETARVAFRILVTERAIEIPTDRSEGVFRRRQESMFQRPRGNLTDEQETCVQHAAQKLIQRAEELWAGLLSKNPRKYLGISKSPTYSPAIWLQIRTYVSQVAEAATTDAQSNDTFLFNLQDGNRARFVSDARIIATRSIFEQLLPVQAVLTSFFWDRLSSYSSQRHLRWEAVTSAFPEFWDQFAAAIHKLYVKWASPRLEVNIARNGPLVLGLSDEEFKFLPLWAGGLDDGTGGVFQPEIPNALHGFPIEPGPVFITGESIPDIDTSTEDGGTTIYTGTETVTMTQGYSVQATRSHTIKTDYDDVNHAALATTSRHSTLDSVVGADATVPRTVGARHIDEDFDWTATGSDCSDLSDLGGSDSDFGFEEIGHDDGDIEQATNTTAS
ncbi:hypothetical protein NPX13_g9426 [Xylaria arbuscula]|uniref:Uncharacterized protein n=1 Tax=Xylaria arbuscula TaxID=114810 RepID=A0A9W8THH5_9PEZI|nr:hypothetical protein NPX13_g9426 [Xylaria arbuscula]